MTTAAEIAAARAAILEQIAAGKGLVEYEVGGRRYKYAPREALGALRELEIDSAAAGSSMANRRTKAGFRR